MVNGHVVVNRYILTILVIDLDVLFKKDKEWFSNTAGKPQSTNNSSKKLASVDDVGLQNFKWLCPNNYEKHVCVTRKCTQY